MALRNIVKLGDPVLNKTSRKVEKFDEKLAILIDDMLETMYHANGVGLAAVQVGMLKRVVVIDIGQCLCQGGVFTHPAVEFLQGEHGVESRAVKLCKFGFGVRADDEIGFGCVFFFSLIHGFDYLIVTYCKCTEKYPECSVFLYSFFLKLCHRSSFFVIGASGVSYL